MEKGVMIVETLLLLGVVFCCGCTEEPAGGGDLTGTVWMLESYLNTDGTAIQPLATAPITADFADGSVGGTSGCNTYNAEYATDGQSLSVDMPTVTMMYCDESGVMEQESEYLALLQSSAGYTVSGDQLTVTDSSGQDILVFRAVDQNLAETEWRLTGYNNGAGGFVSVITGTAVTAKFSDGDMISGNAGCNSYSGAYGVTGTTISIGPLAVTEMYCMEPDGLMAQESAYLTAIGMAESYLVGPGDMVLYNEDGQRMAVFERYEQTITGTEWKVASYKTQQGDTKTPLANTTLTAIFGDDGQVTGIAGCNSYFSSYTSDGSTISIGPAGSTRMYCEEPEGVMEQESEYLGALERATSYELSGSEMTLYGDDGIWIIRFEQTG